MIIDTLSVILGAIAFLGLLVAAISSWDSWQ